MKVLGDTRTAERVNRNEEVPGVTCLMVEHSFDEIVMGELQRQRLLNVSDAVRCVSQELKDQT